jgi:hypothetical protein
MPIHLKQTLPRPSRLKLTDKALMREIGDMAITAIRARTRHGRDSSGQAFAPYSPQYAKRKADELGASDTPNLTVSGDMLNTLQIIDVQDDAVTLGWRR